MGVLLLAWLGASKELIIGGRRCGSDVEINMVCSNQILGVMFANSNKTVMAALPVLGKAGAVGGPANGPAWLSALKSAGTAFGVTHLCNPAFCQVAKGTERESAEDPETKLAMMLKAQAAQASSSSSPPPSPSTATRTTTSGTATTSAVGSSNDTVLRAVKAEPGSIEAALRASGAVTTLRSCSLEARFMDPLTGKVETPAQHGGRMLFYDAILVSLQTHHPYITRRVVAGDVAALAQAGAAMVEGDEVSRVMSAVVALVELASIKGTRASEFSAKVLRETADRVLSQASSQCLVPDLVIRQLVFRAAGTNKSWSTVHGAVAGSQGWGVCAAAP